LVFAGNPGIEINVTGDYINSTKKREKKCGFPVPQLKSAILHIKQRFNIFYFLEFSISFTVNKNKFYFIMPVFIELCEYFLQRYKDCSSFHYL
jgi:hypothetical protein